MNDVSNHLAGLTKLTKSTLCGGLDTQEHFYKAEEVAALVAKLTTPLADPALAELEALEKQATLAPWTHAEAFFVACPRQYYIVDTWERQTPKAEMRGNAALIAAMRNALPGLLAERKDLLARLRTAEAAATELPKVQEYVASLLNDLLNHPQLHPTIQQVLRRHQEQLTVKGAQSNG